MRIIGGQYSGRRLKSIERPGLRPTTDRVRESVFNMLASRVDIEGLRVLDLFAGTGALGLEALSRGAAHCDFVERDRRAAGVIASNVEALGAQSRANIITRDAMKFIDQTPEHYDLIFADPPYAATIFQALGVAIFNRGLLAADGYFVLEHAGGMHVGTPGGAELVVERSFGDTGVHLFLRNADDAD